MACFCSSFCFAIRYYQSGWIANILAVEVNQKIVELQTLQIIRLKQLKDF